MGITTEAYKKDLEQWLKQVKELFSIHETTITEAIGKERTGEFVEMINSMEDSLVDDDRRETESVLFDKATQLHHEWSQIQAVIEAEDNRNHMSYQPIPIGKHTLPPLPYPYDALEPYIDQEIMMLHHQKHHQGYVDGLNKAELEMEKARKKDNFDLIKHWEREAAFNGAGHYLHTIFWNIMGPNGGKEPTGKLAEQIRKDFGSFQKFKKHFTEAAKNVEAVGWAILVWAPRSHRLEILQAEKHQNLSQWDVIPLLVLDVWEHAYYLQYKNERAAYVNNWWNVVNWKHVNQRFEQAKELKWQPY